MSCPAVVLQLCRAAPARRRRYCPMARPGSSSGSISDVQMMPEKTENEPPEEANQWPAAETPQVVATNRFPEWPTARYQRHRPTTRPRLPSDDSDDGPEFERFRGEPSNNGDETVQAHGTMQAHDWNKQSAPSDYFWDPTMDTLWECWYGRWYNPEGDCWWHLQQQTEGPSAAVLPEAG